MDKEFRMDKKLFYVGDLVAFVGYGMAGKVAPVGLGTVIVANADLDDYQVAFEGFDGGYGLDPSHWWCSGSELELVRSVDVLDDYFQEEAEDARQFVVMHRDPDGHLSAPWYSETPVHQGSENAEKEARSWALEDPEEDFVVLEIVKTFRGVTRSIVEVEEVA
jgi:hypothetical protein